LKSRATFTFLVGALTVLTVLAALPGCQADGDRPGFVVLPGMVDSGVVHAYDESPVTKNGEALMLPPEGSVPMGFTPFAYGAGPEEAQRAGRELGNPLEAAPANLARGKQVFETICFVCHGMKGEGDGPIIGRFPNPPSLMAAHAKSLPDGQIFHVITRGQGIMPSHAVQVLAEDRWRVILYLRQIQGTLSSATEPHQPPTPASRVAGSAEVRP
jgi:mono/diheme cytochrome c family protein